MGKGGGDYRSEERRRKKKTMQVGKTEKRGEKREEGRKKLMQGVCFEPCLVE